MAAKSVFFDVSGLYCDWTLTFQQQREEDKWQDVSHISSPSKSLSPVSESPTMDMDINLDLKRTK